MLADALDVGEDVVPAAAVEARHVVAQFVDDLVHLEGGGQGLDQHRRLEGPVRHAERLFGVGEGVIPQPRLEMGLHLGQVEGGRRALGDLGRGIVEDVEAEIEQRPAHRLAVDLDVALGQVPAARTHHQHRRVGLQRIGLAGGLVGEVDRVGPAILEVDLALDEVAPGRAGGVLEVGHEHLGPAVEGVDDHLAVDRAGDFDPAVLEVRGDRRHLPVAGADVGGFGEEVRGFAGVELHWRVTRAARSSRRRASKARWRPARKSRASGVRISAARPLTGPRT